MAARPGVLRRAAVPAGLALVLLPGCGEIPAGGPQDKDEPPGNYEVRVLDASFGTSQQLAKRSTMDIVVRNTGEEVIPNINVTLGTNVNNGRSDDTERIGDFQRRKDDANPTDPNRLGQQSDPNRPQFIVNKAPIDYFLIPPRPERPNPADTRRYELQRRTDEKRHDIQREVRAAQGMDPIYVDTYALGRLDPGKTRRFRWDVTAVEPGPYVLRWRVQAGLDGRAKAVLPGGGVPRGTFQGVIDRTAPDTEVDFSDGTSVTR